MDTEQPDNDAQDQVIPGVTPGALLDAMEDPDIFEAIARADLYAQLAFMRRHASSPEIPFSQRVEYSKFLAKMGKVEAPPSGNNIHENLPAIQIILPNSGGQVNIGGPPAQALPEKDVTPKQSKAVLP